MSEQRFFIGTDQDSHRYIIPIEKREDWIAWCHLGEDHPFSCKIPEYAKILEVSLTRLTFTNPQYE